MQDKLKEIESLIQLLQIEKEEDFNQFRDFVQSLSLSERREKGLCWHPLNVIKTGYIYGERAFIVVEKTKAYSRTHQFRSGMPVRLFTLQDDETYEKNGVIHFVDKQKMKIILNSKDIPFWLEKGSLGVDLLFDERTYIEMEKILKELNQSKGNRLAELRDIYLGIKKPSFHKAAHFIELPSLNKSQNEAINTIFNAQDIAIVHGPPGTGKTTTIVQAIKILSAHENHILVTAPSNAAVDLLTERIAAVGVAVTRVGNISRVDERLIDLTLEGQLSKHPESKNIKKVKIQAAQCRKNAAKYKRTFGFEERKERRELYAEAKELDAWANQLEERIIEKILHSSKVITCTLINATRSELNQLTFDTVFIDEAAQALIPATWIPISVAQKVVLAGDPHQLPPTVKSKKAEKGGFNITMIERCIERFSTVNLLNVQYRMNHKIMGFSNQQFYNSRLIADISVEKHVLPIETSEPLVYIDTAGCSFEEQQNLKTKSRFNPNELNILREHLYQLLAQYTDNPIPSIGIISPYSAQVIYMKEILETDENIQPHLSSISINTIDAFQGQEREVIYISLVRSNEKSEIGFLADYRRMNVAMTRAKKKLVIIGDSATIGGHSFYNDFLNYVEKYGQYQSAWEYMYS